MIKLYTNHCPLCDHLKDLLDEKKVNYQIVDDLSELQAVGIIRTPMLCVNGDMMKYAQALKWVEGVNNGSN